MYFCEPVLLLALFVSMIVVMFAPKRTDKDSVSL